MEETNKRGWLLIKKKIKIVALLDKEPYMQMLYS